MVQGRLVEIVDYNSRNETIVDYNETKRNETRRDETKQHWGEHETLDTKPSGTKARSSPGSKTAAAVAAAIDRSDSRSSPKGLSRRAAKSRNRNSAFQRAVSAFVGRGFSRTGTRALRESRFNRNERRPSRRARAS